MKTYSEICWGIIGAGDVCEIKSAPALWQTKLSRVKWVMRRNKTKAQDFASRHKIPNWTSNINDILTDDEVNAIYIATPPSSHAELTVKAAKAGKAVYVEKPMALNKAECMQMIDACAQSNVPLYVAYYRRVLPGFLKVKDLITKGSIGKIRNVHIEMIQGIKELIESNNENWRIQPQISGGGYFHDLASHQLDYLDFLFGEIDFCNGIASNQGGKYEADDTVTAIFKFQNGIHGSGSWCFCGASSCETDRITIVGSEGNIQFNCFGSPMKIELRNNSSNISTFEYTHEQPIQAPLILRIVNDLTKNKCLHRNAVSAARTTEVMEKICKKNN